MTLYKQIVFVIVLLSILILAGTIVINVHNTRDYLQTQLESHAQDTATSLGLSLSPQMANNDTPTMISMVDAIFDRGDYETITLRRIDGEEIWVRKLQVRIEGVPQWLFDWIELDAPEASAIIMSGWNQAGEVYVKSHPGFAYHTLWQTIQNMLWWFTGLTIVLLLLAGLAVRMLLRPLERLEAQTVAVSNRCFDEITEVPRTRELRNVIKAMNYMTGKVKKMFEEQSESTERLRSLSFIDSLTGLHNRRYFDAALNSSLSTSTEHHEGALLLIQILDLQGINQRLGFEKGDAVIKMTGGILQDCVDQASHTVIARLSGGDFAVMAENISEQQAGQLADDICHQLMRLHTEGVLDTDQICCVGIAMFATGMKYGDVLSRGDTAMQTARVQGANNWAAYVAPEQEDAATPGRHAWQEIIRDAVVSENIVLHAQRVVSVDNKNDVLHREVLLRLPGPDDVLWTAGMFMPVAEQIGQARQLDQIIIRKVLAGIEQSAGGAHLAINVSAASLHQPEFASWLDSVLDEAGSSGQSIVFELSESTVVRELERVSALADVVRRRGYGFAVDHFGRGMTAFGYLQSLRPDYVKIDGLYMTDVANSQDDQFFVGSLCKVAHSLDITVIAESVENDAQIAALKELGVDGVQGYGIGRPGPL